MRHNQVTVLAADRRSFYKKEIWMNYCLNISTIKRATPLFYPAHVHTSLSQHDSTFYLLWIIMLVWSAPMWVEVELFSSNFCNPFSCFVQMQLFVMSGFVRFRIPFSSGIFSTLTWPLLLCKLLVVLQYDCGIHINTFYITYYICKACQRNRHLNYYRYNVFFFTIKPHVFVLNRAANIVFILWKYHALWLIRLDLHTVKIIRWLYLKI